MWTDIGTSLRSDLNPSCASLGNPLHHPQVYHRSYRLSTLSSTQFLASPILSNRPPQLSLEWTFYNDVLIKKPACQFNVLALPPCSLVIRTMNSDSVGIEMSLFG